MNKLSKAFFLSFALSVAGLIVWIMSSLCFAGTNETYTVTIPAVNLTLSNVVSFTNCSPYCTGIRYLQDGRTNTFHAFAVSFSVTTNHP